MAVGSWLQQFILTFTALFVAIDVIGAVPRYLSLSQDVLETERRKTLIIAMSVAVFVALVFVLLGSEIFHYLGIDAADFKIAGGLVLLLVSLSDLLYGPDALLNSSGSTGVVPLAVPLITGPGLITTLILQVPAVGHLITLLALAANMLLAWVVLFYSQKIARILGRDGTVVVSKISALLLVAIAVAMIRHGVTEIIGHRVALN